MEILKLKLYTTRLSEQFHFYAEHLGFTIKNKENDHFTLEAGKTDLIFERSDMPQPTYHFAFLIPHHLINDAVRFVQTKGLDIIKYKGSNTIDFGNGKSVYFHDKDQNIVEFIERPSLGYFGSSAFHISQVLKVNEIGLPVDDTFLISKQLIDRYGVKLIDPDHLSEKFCWIGDFNGAFIVTRIGRNWLPTTIPSRINDFCIEINTAPNQTFSICMRKNVFSEWSPGE